MHDAHQRRHRAGQVDKLSLPLTIVLAAVWLHEPMNWQVLLGVAMMTAGSLVIWYWSAPA